VEAQGESLALFCRWAIERGDTAAKIAYSRLGCCRTSVPHTVLSIRPRAGRRGFQSKGSQPVLGDHSRAIATCEDVPHSLTARRLP
jgi:hypothetical protein